MSELDTDIEIPNVEEDIGLGDEDKGKVQSNQLEWYKGEKGRTDRIALVYFNSIDTIQLRKALKEKPDLSQEQQRTLIKQVRAKIAEKRNKAIDQLDAVDLLDTSEARFKPASAVYKKDVLGFVAWPKVMAPGDERVWAKAGEKKDYVVTVVLWYPTDREGEVDRDRLAKHWRVMPWRTTPEQYNNLRRINKGLVADGSSISQIDLNLTCTDTQFQKNTLTQAGTAIYLKNESFKRIVLEKAVTLYSKLAPFRELTTDELREKLGIAGGGSGGSGASNQDFSDADFSNVLGNV